MEHRSFALGAGLSRLALALPFVGLIAVAPALADDPMASKRARAKELEVNANAIRTDAAKTFKEEELDCRQGIFVNDCINAAKERRLEKIKTARSKEAEQAVVEREIRHAEHVARREAKIRRRVEEGPPPAVIIQTDRPAVEAVPLK